MLAGLAEITPPYEPADCEHSFYLYTCLVPEAWAGEKRDKLMQMLQDEYAIGCIVANRPAYLTRQILADHSRGQRNPLSEAVTARLFCVSLHPAMSDELNRDIAAAMCRCVARLRHA
jgi:dTDP-4-amino-4,6-dideoxygalactose transaminase